VADADAEHEAARICLAERVSAVAHGQRVAPVDVGDAGGDDQPLGGGEQDARVGEGLLVDRALADPQRRVAERLDLRRGGALLLCRGAAKYAEPDADLPKTDVRHMSNLANSR
jgi:hypothetical protein